MLGAFCLALKKLCYGQQKRGRCTMTQTKKKKKTLKTVGYCFSAVVLCAVLYAVVFTAVVKIKNPQGLSMPF